MPTDLPLHLFIAQVILHTPVWVWGVLVAITALGLRQAFDQVMPLRRLILVPLIWSVLSLWGAAHAFGAHAVVLSAWLAGAALTLAAGLLMAAPRGVRALGDGRYEIAGSLWPLLIIWSVFMVRYASGVMLALNPALRESAAFTLAVPMAYGALSGVFMARSARILRSARPHGALALA